MDIVPEIKNKLSIEEVVAPYVTLHKAGRSLKALCPFHQEKTPSFFVSPEKQLAYCFGCQRGGDIFKFIQEIEGFDFPEALKFLAEKAGVEIPKHYEAGIKTKKERLKLINRRAKEIFSDTLRHEGKKALEYLGKKRKLEDKIIEKFELGYARESENFLSQTLQKEGFTKEELMEAGLVFASGKDRFIGRIMFPIHDAAGYTVAFGGRAFLQNQEPKYLNSPETVLYEKSNILYGLNFAKETVKKTGEAVIVEGYMDALRCYEAGFNNIVGTCGTAFTSMQMRILKRYTNTLTLFFDGDEAGKISTLRAFQIATSEGLSVKVLRPPKDLDPDEWIKKSKKDVEEGLKNAPYFFDFLFDEIKKVHDFRTVEGQKRAASEVLPLFPQIKNRIEQDKYIQKFASLLGTSPQKIYDEMNQIKTFGSFETEAVKTPSKFSTEEYLIGCLLSYPESFEYSVNKIFPDDLSSTQNRLYEILEDAYNHSRYPVFNYIPDDLINHARLLAFFAETQNAALSTSEMQEELKRTIDKFLTEVRERKKERLLILLKETEQKRDKKALQNLLSQYQSLLTR